METEHANQANLERYVCYEKSSTPNPYEFKQLSCRHVICFKCINQIAALFRKDKPGGNFQCELEFSL